MDTLGSQLKAARLARGLTREQLSIAANVKADHIRYIEHDYVDFPRAKTLAKLTRALGVRVAVSVVADESEEA